MNLVKSRALHPHLRDDEALVVENAIRLAIDSILNVLYGVNSGRTHEQQRMVADRDKEIRRLEGRLTEMEQDLRLLRRRGCTCGLYVEKERGLAVAGSQPAGDPQTTELGGFEPSYVGAEMSAGQQECEMSISLGLFARPPSHVSSQSHESAFPSSPSRMGLDQSCTPHSSESSEAARNLPTSPRSLVIKEEPCDIDAILIKWEMSEERSAERQESSSSPRQDEVSPGDELGNDERTTLRENPHPDPGRLCDPHELHLGNKKKGVPMSDLTEEAQKLKRAAWRAASRRYYARKVARQQANPPRLGPFPPRPGPFPSRSAPFPSRSAPFPSRSAPFPSRSAPFPSRSAPFPSRSAPFPHINDSRHLQPVSFADKRRRTLISELPEDSQSQQREAWRAASRRYYARKTARPQTESPQYAHLIQTTEPSGETLGPNRGGSHTSSGGIMCSC